MSDEPNDASTTNDPRSSSIRPGVGVCDAVVRATDGFSVVVGPVRLPMTRADDFIDQFNRTYAKIGITLTPIPRSRRENVDGGGAADET